MANILYGVNGEGSGHSTRAKQVIEHLIHVGHKVRIVSFDRGLRNLSESFEVTEIYGFRLAYVNNRVRYKRTLGRNLLAIPSAARSFKKLMRLAEEWQIQLVVTDFEPLSCHVGRRKRLPVISIDNQHLLTHAEVSYPRFFRGDAAATKLVTRMMTPGANAYMVTSFFPARIRQRNTCLVPPIVREEVLRTKPAEGDHVLVYVTSPSPDLIRLLRQVRCNFTAYGFDREGKDGNIDFKKPSLNRFLEDLGSAKAIVANAGFSLVSEALYLAKPYLAVPVKHQFEQIFNAYQLAKTGYGAYWEQLTKERIECFLFNLPVFRENLAKYPRQDNSLIFDTLDSLIASHLSAGRAAGRA